MKQIAKFLLDVVEVYVPTIAFTLLFIVFIIQVFFRYFLVPLTWPLEFTLIAFIWTPASPSGIIPMFSLP